MRLFEEAGELALFALVEPIEVELPHRRVVDPLRAA
jgi:hypothetical protein